DRVDAFLANAPKMLEFLEANTAATFDLSPLYADYHQTYPGARPGGRTVFPSPLDARVNMDDVKRFAPSVPEFSLFGMRIGSGRELQHFLHAMHSARSFLYVARRLLGHFGDLVRYGRSTRLTNGQALLGHLVLALRREGGRLRSEERRVGKECSTRWSQCSE